MNSGEKIEEWRKRKSLSDLINNNKYINFTHEEMFVLGKAIKQIKEQRE